jgi:hypothetical protein
MANGSINFAHLNLYNFNTLIFLIALSYKTLHRNQDFRILLNA